ncbi:unnamed protein product [Penicillium olsonii]|uniref:Uncharacterized protein n=1 Tax=Penicillium olsonii TaxID=99116 RepID=A0A9W4N123_PENOL|nr:unnamed protein product [Penicillium olsonii]CAG8279672.1 unnamed protein product [Penicillium olsonii]
MSDQYRQLVPGSSPISDDQENDELEHSPPPEKGTWKKRVSTACLACKKSKRKVSQIHLQTQASTSTSSPSLTTTSAARRRVAAKRTADELSYHRDFLADVFKLVREANESHALHLLTIIRHNAPADEIRAYINDTLHSLNRNDDTPKKEQTITKLEDMRHLLNVEGSTPAFRRKVMDIHYLCDDAPCTVPAEPWTNVTADGDLVSHLVSLYFAWNWPFSTFLDKDVFLKHMRRGEIGSEFCSPFLVNAVLSNACYFSEFSEAYVVPGDISSKGSDFLAEAERLKKEGSSQPSLAGLQGALLLYERSVACI